MSWLFGYKPSTPPTVGEGMDMGGGGNPPQEPKEPNLSKAEKKAMEAYRFDSSALERAAKAAKELESSSKNLFLSYFVTISLVKLFKYCVICECKVREEIIF